ncbi:MULTISPECIES: MsnO8 family LLM class oxidoreductase [unclassified Modestobacter]|uniref:MsnO8 family LLM class oxidoreductase n=1 Tax=unclassified Modestobacter TaxID=2643866 RepID=UPI0022AA8296|nr:MULTISPECIES: MsnO8 family LLM class oxidoreductase [unclassified Modestobacter]MCZ2824150.1 MsnO8 family LLM class oxidoreductase [Modestobacter sp. VKM Ac-2981]MCZ2854322.1 MsnO8 family LLM class oxidoreductase [Modestobacter sp. VKM Ac-2982]
MQLSLLDRARTRAGEPDAAALTGTVARAALAEQLGYDRFWVAEHHGVPGVAGSAPAVLLAAIAGRTTTVRLGSAGVMLPHHQPLVVAEQFATLSALAPGRVDLGLGRSPGFTAPVRRALRSTDEHDFAGDLAELRAFLTGSAEITAYPRPTTAVPMYVLATGQGLQVAAELGLPVIVGGPLLGVAGDPEPGLAALAGYRRDYRPNEQAPQPRVAISLDVLVADSAAEASDLLLPEAWAMAQARTTGAFPPLEPVAGIRARTLSARQQSYVDQTAAAAIAGTPAQVASRLTELIERTGAAELVASSSTHDRAALAASDAALAGVLGHSHTDR